MEILNSASMSEADRLTIQETGIPSAVLMENAARSVFEYIASLDIPKERIAIAAGSGNNGGDGFALARHLANAGVVVDVFACNPEKLKGDAKLNYDILLNFPVSIIELAGEAPFFDSYDITVDAIFGTGFKGEVTGFYADLIESVNETSNYVISIDIPSGLSGSSHNVAGICVDADATVTFCRPKIPHCMFPAKKFCGEIAVTDISIPDFNVDKVSEGLFLLTEDLLPRIPRRTEDSHKGTYGHAVIAGGSAGKTGAAMMASLSCLTAGAGLVTCMLPASLNYVAENGAFEVMSFPVGKGDHFHGEDYLDAVSFLKDKKVLAIGTGIGRNEETGEFIRRILKATSLPAVIDADGLYHTDKETLSSLSGRAVLTPHIGEFARMTGLNIEQVQADRLNLARSFAAENGVVLVLKSADTIIATPEGITFISINGSPALAKGGSGDCLTGLITGFISQGYEPAEAAVLGSYILGAAGRKAAEEMSERSVMTSHVIKQIGTVISELED
jgi:NAD(P)H-hydrate epimerase